MAKEIKLTQESLDAYKDELEYLKTTRADEVAEQLKEARSFGDLSENAKSLFQVTPNNLTKASCLALPSKIL